MSLVRDMHEIARARFRLGEVPARHRDLWQTQRAEGPWMQTASGGVFPFLAPEAGDIIPEEIATSLSKLVRFTGHAYAGQNGAGYTVAQHSVHVSYLVPEQDALAGLLHDATEAYVGDMASPLKRLLPDYILVENIAWMAVCERFGLPYNLSVEVHEADLVMLATEKRDLMEPEPKPWVSLPRPRREPIEVWRQEDARHAFLARLYDLTGC